MSDYDNTSSSSSSSSSFQVVNAVRAACIEGLANCKLVHFIDDDACIVLALAVDDENCQMVVLMRPQELANIFSRLTAVETARPTKNCHRRRDGPPRHMARL